MSQETFNPQNQMPKKIHPLPHGLVLHIKQGLTEIGEVSHISLIPLIVEGNIELEAEPVADWRNPGGDISIALFKTKAEAQAFRDGFDHACPGDDFSYCLEEVYVKPHGSVHVFLCHNADSDANHCTLMDYT